MELEPDTPSFVHLVPDETLIAFLSDSHIGGDPGADIFESPDQLIALLNRLGAHDGRVELVLAGDLFDFLEIGPVPTGQDRAAMTIARREYRELFDALHRLKSGDDRHVTYLPGNHDAELWWNPEIGQTLQDADLIHHVARSYTAAFASTPDRLVYCEHGNQFDPPNAISDYTDPFDTPLGHHIVTDFTRRVVPRGFISRALDLRDLNKVYPLAAIPAWISGRIFYDLLSRVVRFIVLPLLVASVLYNSVAYATSGASDARSVIVEVWWDALLLVVVAILFFLAIRRSANRVLEALTAPLPNETADSWRFGASIPAIRALLDSDEHPPMTPELRGRQIDVFVSGHTHAPALSDLERTDGSRAVVANSGCWLRQLRPVPAHFGGPPVLVSEYVLSHVEVTLQSGKPRVDLWDHPRSAPRHERLAERLAILGRRPPTFPDREPRIVASRVLTDRDATIEGRR